MLTILVVLGILFLVIWNIKRMLHNFETNQCSGCRGNCRSCEQTGSSLIERYHQGELHSKS